MAARSGMVDVESAASAGGISSFSGREFGQTFVTIRWEKGGLAVPLSQFIPIRATDQETVALLFVLSE